MVAAVLLAGGDSRRMGQPKGLLRAPDGRFFVRRIVDELLAGGAGRVVVVTGGHHDALLPVLEPMLQDSRVEVVRNPVPSRGQLSSLWVGMDTVVAPGVDALLVTLVDVPLVDAALVRRLLTTWRETRAPIVRPGRNGRHGHPVVFDRRLFDELRSAPPDAGAKAVIRRHLAEAIDLPVDDDACLRDVDTPEDYVSLMRAEPEPGEPPA